jgi:general secretion pathway protein J
LACKRIHPESGLTLIEVLIAVGLFAFISVGIYEATTRAFDVNFRLRSESNDYSAVSLTIQAIERDFSQIFTPQLGTTPARLDPQAQPSTFWSPVIRSDGFRRTRFLGTKEKVSFVANNNRRVEADSPQSDFQKITWEIERNAEGAYSLYRSTDWDVYQYDDATTRPPMRIALLENLSSASFRYYRKENKTWEEQWDSESPYAKPEFRYPELISLKFEVPDPLNPATQQPWELILKPNLPLNPPVDPAKAGAKPGGERGEEEAPAGEEEEP